MEIARIAGRPTDGERSLRDTLNGLTPFPKITVSPQRGGTEVYFDRIEGDLLMHWFDRVRRDTAWVVRSARIAHSEPGWVSAKVELLESVR